MAREHRIYLAWAAVWLFTRGLMVAQVGFWDDVNGVDLEDVEVFSAWSDFIASQQALPSEDSWQYPPGAGYLMLVPRIGGDFGESFVATMLVLDLVGLVLLAALAARQRRDTGVWVWLLAMPALFTLPVLRFDLAPTVLAIAALVVVHRRPLLFGALAGLGATIKVWPLVVLLAEWDRGRLLRAIAAAFAAALAVFLVAALAFGDPTGFLGSQGARGLQVEAIAASPWQLMQVITGEPPLVVQQFGTNEIGSRPAQAVATALEVLTLCALAAAAAWWWARDRAIRNGRGDLADEAVGRDYVFAVVLLLVVSNKVLSPQFLIWLVGLAAIVLSAGTAAMARPAWMVLAAVALTPGVFAFPAILVVRNVALLVAAVDATLAMARLVRRPTPGPAGASVETAAAALRRP